MGGVTGNGKIADKNVSKSLDDAFNTAKTLHKHFKVCFCSNLIILCIYEMHLHIY